MAWGILFVPWLWLYASWRSCGGWNFPLAPRALSTDNATVHNCVNGLCCGATWAQERRLTLTKVLGHSHWCRRAVCNPTYCKIVHVESWAQEYAWTLMVKSVFPGCVQTGEHGDASEFPDFLLMPAPRPTPVWGAVQVLFSNTLVSGERTTSLWDSG